MSVTRAAVGVDISKAWFDVSCEDRTARFENSVDGFEEFASWLGNGAFHICVEPTGGYETPLRAFCEARSIVVSVANPAQVSAFGKATGRRHKTDKVDAQLLESYLKTSAPRASLLDEEPRRELRKLVSTWKDLQAQHIALGHRLGSPDVPKAAQAGLRAALEGLNAAMLGIMGELASLLARQADIAEDVALLESIKGIGRSSALQILAQLPEGALRSARELASYAGTVPCHIESGSSVRRRGAIPGRCNRRLRNALYMPAMVARRHCPHLKSFGDRLADNGKGKKQVITAVMRKLVHAIHAVLTSRQPYNGAKLCPRA